MASTFLLLIFIPSDVSVSKELTFGTPLLQFLLIELNAIHPCSLK